MHDTNGIWQYLIQSNENFFILYHKQNYHSLKTQKNFLKNFNNWVLNQTLNFNKLKLMILVNLSWINNLNNQSMMQMFFTNLFIISSKKYNWKVLILLLLLLLLLFLRFLFILLLMEIEIMVSFLLKEYLLQMQLLPIFRSYYFFNLSCFSFQELKKIIYLKGIMD